MSKEYTILTIEKPKELDLDEVKNINSDLIASYVYDKNKLLYGIDKLGNLYYPFSNCSGKSTRQYINSLNSDNRLLWIKRTTHDVKDY